MDPVFQKSGPKVDDQTQFEVQQAKIGRIIIEAAIEVHRTLGGPGLLESAYEASFTHELTLRGLKVARQKRVPLYFKGKRLPTDLRLDLLVEDTVVVECKATTAYNKVWEAQVLVLAACSESQTAARDRRQTLLKRDDPKPRESAQHSVR